MVDGAGSHSPARILESPTERHRKTKSGWLSLSEVNCCDQSWLNSDLLRRPFVPVLREFVHVVLRHRNKRTYDFFAGRIFLQIKFVHEQFHGTMTPFIILLGKE